MSKLISGKVKKIPSTEVSADRYNFISLPEVEPDLGVPAVSGYILSSDANGNREWREESIGGTIDLTSQITGVLPIANGGTGASNNVDALLNLGITATASEINTLDGITSTTIELNYVSGVTSGIQDQIDSKAPINTPIFIGEVTATSFAGDGSALTGIYPDQTGEGGKYLRTDGSSIAWEDVTAGGYSSRTIQTNTILDSSVEYFAGSNTIINHGATLTVPHSTLLEIKYYSSGKAL